VRSNSKRRNENETKNKKVKREEFIKTHKPAFTIRRRRRRRRSQRRGREGEERGRDQ